MLRFPRFSRYALLVLLVPLAWLSFRLFEPLLTWSSGWQALPADTVLAAGVSTSAPDWQATAAQADRALREARARLDAPALSAAIMVDGQRVWAGAVGMADLAAARPVDLTSVFRLGSSSKAVNGLALGVLMEAGRIDIEKSVRRYLPDLPASYEPVTTRLAISHQAGVPDYGLCFCFPIWEHKNRRHFETQRDTLRVFEDRPLLFAPGEGFKYSSYSVNVTGAVMEAIVGRPYGDFIRDAIFKPLGMSHSELDVSGAILPKRVAFYEVTEQRYKLADPVDNSIRYPSGGMLSTPSDMLALGQAWLGNELLNDATRQRLLTPQRLKDGSDNPQSYALGMRVFKDKKLFDNTLSTPFYSHHGTAVGSTSYFAIYPEFGLVVSVMMNKGQENLDALAPEANRLVELFLAQRRLNPPRP